jgi:hypothetical protein
MTRNYIHDIKPSSRSQKHREALERERDLRMRKLGSKRADREADEESYYEPKKKSSGKGIWYVAGFTIVLLVFALTFVFAGATVYVTPREGTVNLSGPLLAEKESKTGLTFQMISIENEKSITVPSGEEKYTEKVATGKIRFFNTYSANPQKLLIDTRVTDPTGKIYKTKVAVTIPGDKVDGGKVIPGTLDVDVYADAPGEDYNIPMNTDLKIFGFKGTPKYDDIYAKSISEISGGFKGNMPGIADTDLKAGEDKLKIDLQASLLEKAKAQLPEGFVMYDKTSVTQFDEPTIESGTNGSDATIKQRGTMNAIIFKEADLSKALVKNVVEDPEKVTVSNLKDLDIELDPSSAILTPALMQNIKINVSDDIHVIWNIDEDEIKSALVGSKKRDFASKMLEFKNIDKAELSLKPFWKMDLPEKPNAIKVVNSLEQTNS